jgi:hypothetical protein
MVGSIRLPPGVRFEAQHSTAWRKGPCSPTARTLHNRDTTLLEALEGNGDDPRERTVTRRGGLLERPAILNRSMPLIAGAAMSIPADLSMRYAIYTFEKQYT